MQLAQGQERHIAESDLSPAALPRIAVASKGGGDGEGDAGGDGALVVAARAQPGVANPRGPAWVAGASFGLGSGVAEGSTVKAGRLTVERDTIRAACRWRCSAEAGGPTACAKAASAPK